MIIDYILQFYVAIFAVVKNIIEWLFSFLPLETLNTYLPDFDLAISEFTSYITFLDPLVPVTLIFTLLTLVFSVEIGSFVIKQIIMVKQNIKT